MALLSIRRRFNLKSKLDREAAIVPEEFRCPISLEMMRDPVTAATGITYDRLSIEAWLGMGNSTCPVTGREFAGGVEGELVPNHSLRKMIQDWCVANRSLGVERIPTPRIPVTDADVAGALSEIAAASRRGEGPRCARVAAQVRRWARESERNRARIVSHGACAPLASALCEVAAPEHAEEILAALAAISPLDEAAARAAAASPAALRFLARTLTQGTTLAARGNAAWMLRQMATASRRGGGDGWRAAAETEGMVEALVETVRRPVSSAATKAALVCIMQAARGSEAAAQRAAEAGAVEAVVEMVGEAGERSTCEKALGALEGMARWEAGRRRARGHALAVPVLVKKMFRVSELATELAVSALLKLCEGGGDDDDEEEEAEERRRCAVEAVEGGAFQKLLLLLQVGCSDEGREWATTLLRLLNRYRERNECIDSMDLRGLKRPF